MAQDLSRLAALVRWIEIAEADAELEAFVNDVLDNMIALFRDFNQGRYRPYRPEHSQPSYTHGYRLVRTVFRGASEPESRSVHHIL